MSSVLQQTLRGLCFDTGWCYAVFWKLKQRPRTVLTWEDAFYGRKIEVTNADSSAITMPGFGQQFCGGLTDMEDPIGLSVAKMSYHVYSVGEGIIGRVAFTNKHQWVLSSNDKGTVANGVSNRKANPRSLPEKYPSGWEQQFAAGIKTIAVVAVPQGVVQLGSTRMIVEDLKLVGHVKALFGTLQSVPGAFLSDIVSEVQKGSVHTVYPLAVPAPHIPSSDPVLMNVQRPTLARAPSLPANLGIAPAGAATFNSNLGCSGVGRLPMMLASQQILTHAHSWPLPPVPGLQENVSHFQHSSHDKPGLESMSQLSFPFFKPSCTWAGPIDKMGISSQPGVAKASNVDVPTLSTGGLKGNPPSRIGIIRHLSLSSKVSSISLPVSKVPFSQAGNSSFSAGSSLTGGKGVSMPMLELPEYLRPHGQSGPVSRTKSPGTVDGNQVAVEPSDIISSLGSTKSVIRTMKENSLCVAGTSGLGNTQSFGCESVGKCQQLLGARPEVEQPFSGRSKKSMSVGFGRMSSESPQAEIRRHLAECQQQSDSAGQPYSGCSEQSMHLGFGRIYPQAESSRHLAKHQQLSICRSSTESEQLNPPSVEVEQLDWGSPVAEKGPGIIGNRLARESRQLISPSPTAASALLTVDRHSAQSGHYLDKPKNAFLQSRWFGGANIATEKIQSSSERSSVESSQPRDNIMPTSMLSGGFSMHLEMSASSTIKESSCMSEFLSMSAETSPLQCERGVQTFTTDNVHLTSQISDLLQLAKEIENADKDDNKDLSCDKVDILQSISSSLLCDDYFESLQSSKSFLENLELNACESGSADNSIENLFMNELEDFDEFFTWLAKEERSKSDTSPQQVLFASKINNNILASLSTEDDGGIRKGKEHCGKNISDSNSRPCQFNAAQTECEPTLHTLDAEEPFSNCFAKESTLSHKESPCIQSEPQFDRKWQLCLLQAGLSKL